MASCLHLSHYLTACSTSLNTVFNFFCTTGIIFLILHYAFAISSRDFNALLIYLASILILFDLSQFLIFCILSEDFNATHIACIYFTDISDILISLLHLAYPLLLSITFHQGFYLHLVEPGSQLNLYSMGISHFPAQ